MSGTAHADHPHIAEPNKSGASASSPACDFWVAYHHYRPWLGSFSVDFEGRGAVFSKGVNDGAAIRFLALATDDLHASLFKGGFELGVQLLQHVAACARCVVFLLDEVG